MAITVYVGKPGHGKTIALMREFENICIKNERIFKKTGFRRTIKVGPFISPQLYARYAYYIEIIGDLDFLPDASHCDIFIDEMGTYFDARQWASLGPEVIHSLRLHRHRGIDIYGATQEFTQVDITLRRLTTTVIRCKKLFSTGEPQPNQPIKKSSFMIGTIGQVKPEHREIETEFQETFNNKLQIYDHDDFSLYDTHFDMSLVPLSPLYLRPREVIKLDRDGKKISSEIKYSTTKI